MALLAFSPSLRIKRTPLQHGLHNQHPTIYTLPRDLQGDDKALGAVHVHRNVSHGIGYYHQHDMSGLCTGMGRVGEVFCLGIVDFRCRCFGYDCFIFAIFIVSSPSLTARHWLMN